ncbi:MAG: Cytochrome c-type biogenesis protein CcdA (DsbD analog) [uncultured Thermomicrobiales bacterium]|uniref:Cytochrome c-type biogenesis protein CcdA (DsbD analog) n=1 Tax=uncultured Thermomicrobiales bacterium TaxID=1645740 RepID=A0A6J4VEL7_9BACT|nr:MAG: Cytochrome c-type biogenesis protein CcdA (DsbD analog) [uncultured Thermomicrobiales bacterium]
MPTDVSLLAAFAAGLFSFSSPCVLPLVPIFLAHLAGVSVGEGGRRARGPLVANAAAYVAGFSVVFVLLGVALGAAGGLVTAGETVAGNRLWLVRLGGALLVLLGLRQLGLVRLPVLDRERRFHPQTTRAGTVTSSFVIGLTFGAGWSPCVGPILGVILTMAAGQGEVERAAVLLATYSAGLGVPFLGVALAFGSAPAILRAVNRRMRMLTSVSGAVMLGTGAVMLLGLYQELFVELVRLAPWTPWEPSL